MTQCLPTDLHNFSSKLTIYVVGKRNTLCSCWFYWLLLFFANIFTIYGRIKRSAVYRWQIMFIDRLTGHFIIEEMNLLLLTNKVEYFSHWMYCWLVYSLIVIFDWFFFLVNNNICNMLSLCWFENFTFWLYLKNMSATIRWILLLYQNTFQIVNKSWEK